MGRADFLELGDHNAHCFECGRKMKASMLEKHWQGYYVCPEHNEPRQTQDFVRAIPDNMSVPWTQNIPWVPKSHESIVIHYDNVVIGHGDGVIHSFQLGTGFPTIVTEARINDIIIGPTFWSANSTGLITFVGIPSPGSQISASGTETIP